MPKVIKRLIVVFFLLASLPVLISAVSYVAKYLTRASIEPANIVIKATDGRRPLVPNWQAFSQGGESHNNMIKPAISQIAALRPKLIRIDHLYDFYDIVSRAPDGSLAFDFTKLDDVVSDILKTGAMPFFSVSYMPSAIAVSDMISLPRSWHEWSLVVQRTIEHYSGASSMNLQNVYYEIWNEPDLFGGFKYWGDKNYLELYRYAALGARAAQNTNFFKLGGPAITGFYPDWMKAFFAFCLENNLKLDFVSWHRYAYNPNVNVEDVTKLEEILKEFPTYENLERHITESGINSELDAAYDGVTAALHQASVFAKLQKKVYQVHTFELVDGASPKGDTFWGRWGLLTNQDKGLIAKPRYFLWNTLNSLSGDLLEVTGDNDFINVIATRDGENYKILIVNFDAENMRVENVPVRIDGTTPGVYYLKLVYPFVSATPFFEQDTPVGSFFTTTVLMDHNSLAVLELTKK